MRAPIVVFAIGNPSRGDDAIGPVLCERLAAWLAEQQLTEQVELIEDFELIFPAVIPTHSTHALPPQAILQVYRQTEGSEPPPSFVLCVRGECFELGEGLSPDAQHRVRDAMLLLQE